MAGTAATAVPADFGENLSANKNIDFIQANGLEDLRATLAAIKLPFRLITIYPLGATHVAWIVPTRRITKVVQKSNQPDE